MRTCPRCGVENKPDRAACWNCWAPLEGAAGGLEPRPVGRGVSVAVPWTAVAVIAIVLVAIAGAWLFFFSSRPADVATSYLDAVRNGNAKKRDRLSTPSTVGESPLSRVMLIGKATVVGPVTYAAGEARVPTDFNLTVDPIEVGLTRASLADTLMKALQAQTVRADVVLVKQGLKWLVDQRLTGQQITQALDRQLAPGVAAQLAMANQTAGMPGALTIPGLTPQAQPAPGPAPSATPAPGPAPAPSPAPAAGAMRKAPAAGAATKAPAAGSEPGSVKAGVPKRGELPGEVGD